jgi:nucleoside-diphosphate-sugar epimerase
MKVLVTGSNGFLGTALVERLIAHGERDIRCFVRPGSDRKRLDDVLGANPAGDQHSEDAGRCEVFTGSLGSVESAAEAIEGVDLIYHLAAGTGGAAADLFLNSAVASKNLLEAIVRSGRKIKVVLISSFGVYSIAPLKRGAVVDESTPLEEHPEDRDLYSYSKLRQEQLFWEYREKHGIELVVLRPGVIYGPGGSAISSRVGLQLGPVFLFLGGRNRIPLTYVENCAEAIVVAGSRPDSEGKVFNVVDDDLPTCKEYLRQYRRQVKRIRCIRVAYPVLKWLSARCLSYHVRSRGQLPAVFTPYKTASTWKGQRFTCERLKQAGWFQRVPTREGMARTFESLRARTN